MTKNVTRKKKIVIEKKIKHLCMNFNLKEHGLNIYILFFYMFQFLECLMKKEYVVAAKLCKMSKYFICQ